MAKNNRGLLPRQRKFAELYAKLGNATQAYIQAGYKGRGHSAEANAEEILRNTDVAAYLAEVNARLSSSRIASAQEIQEFWTACARGELTETVATQAGLEDLPPRLKDRLKASELLGKAKGLFLERVDVTGDMVIRVTLTGSGDNAIDED